METPEVINYVSKYAYAGGDVTDFIKSKNLHENREFLIGLAIILGVSIVFLKKYFGDSKKDSDVGTKDEYYEKDTSIENRVYECGAHIIFLPFNPRDEKTDISKTKFYKNLTEKYGSGMFALTNGANKYLDSGGAGTNGAITAINPEFFDHERFKDLKVHNNQELKSYLENNKEFDEFINSTNQVCAFNNQKFKAGSVFYIQSKLFLIDGTSIPNILISGVYHINGINYQEISNENEKNKFEKMSIPLVKTYITKILEDFANTNTNESKFLVLQPIPGKLYEGSVITERAIYDTVIEFIENKTNHKKLENKVIVLGFHEFKQRPEKTGGEDTVFMIYVAVVIILIIVILFLIYKLLENKPGIYINVDKGVPRRRLW